MPETRLPIALNRISLAELQRQINGRRLPPVETWDPPYCGHSGMRIARDGSWFHEGRLIARPAMVRLFSTILRRESDGSHILVTPVEKLGIDVESTAFRAIEMSSEGTGPNRRIALALDTGDAVIIGPEHPLSIVRQDGSLSPRMAIRNGLEAELSRSVYYELAAIAIEEGADPPGVWSEGRFFPLAAER